MGGGIFALRNDALQGIGQVAVLENIFILVPARTFRALSMSDGETGAFHDTFGFLPTEVTDFTIPMLVHPNGVLLVVAQDQKTLYAGIFGRNGSRFISFGQ